jgi:hypothetical protein
VSIIHISILLNSITSISATASQTYTRLQTEAFDVIWIPKFFLQPTETDKGYDVFCAEAIWREMMWERKKESKRDDNVKFFLRKHFTRT